MTMLLQSDSATFPAVWSGGCGYLRAESGYLLRPRYCAFSVRTAADLRRTIGFSIHAHRDEALLDDVFQNLDVFALLAADDRREQLHARAFGQGKHLIDHLIDGLLGDFPPAFGAVGDADAGIEQAQ